MKRFIAALVASAAFAVPVAAAQAHSVSYNMQRNIASYEQVPVGAVLMAGASLGQWTAETCSNHYIYRGGVLHSNGPTVWDLQGRYTGNISSWSITVELHYNYNCDPSVFGKIVPF